MEALHPLVGSGTGRQGAGGAGTDTSQCFLILRGLRDTRGNQITMGRLTVDVADVERFSQNARSAVMPCRDMAGGNIMAHLENGLKRDGLCLRLRLKLDAGDDNFESGRDGTEGAGQHGHSVSRVIPAAVRASPTVLAWVWTDLGIGRVPSTMVIVNGFGHFCISKRCGRLPRWPEPPQAYPVRKRQTGRTAR